LQIRQQERGIEAIVVGMKILGADHGISVQEDYPAELGRVM